MKSWTYAEITEAAEKRITELATLAKGRPFEEGITRDWAYGVYLGWSALTVGWQEPGDDERMEKLIGGRKP